MTTIMKPLYNVHPIKKYIVRKEVSKTAPGTRSPIPTVAAATKSAGVRKLNPTVTAM
jgi:hypothetical protein